MSRLPKILGFHTLDGALLTAERTVPSGAGPQIVNLDNGDYFASDEGASDAGDLLYELEDSIRNTHANLANFRTALSSSNLVEFYTVLTGETIVITWGAATALRDFLGFSGATTTIVYPTRTTATTVPQISYWSPFGAQTDEPVDVVIRSTSKAIGGQQYTVKLGEHRFIDFGIRFPGWWRNVSDLRYINLQHLWRDHLLEGKRARYYLDKTATGAYDELTNPYGYHLVTLDQTETEWNVRAINRQNRVRYEGSWRLAIYVP